MTIPQGYPCGTVQIRLSGPLGDVLRAEAEIAKSFVILQRSDFYKDTRRAKTGRLYLTVEPKGQEQPK